MSEERPLRISGSDAERLLLAAGSADRPDARSVRQAAERLGLFPAPLVVMGALALALRSAKWTSIVARGLVPLAGVAAVAVAVHAAGPVSPTAGGPLAIAPPVRIANPNARAAEPSPAPQGALPQAPRADVPVPFALPTAPRKTPRAAARVAAPAAPADSLGAQADRLDRVRARVESGDSSGALAALDDYDRRFAGGVLSEESLLLRVEALRRGGDRGAAAALARRFLRTYPASVHVGRVTALLHSLSP